VESSENAPHENPEFDFSPHTANELQKRTDPHDYPYESGKLLHSFPVTFLRWMLHRRGNHFKSLGKMAPKDSVLFADPTELFAFCALEVAKNNAI
jgi:hypothetical protein